MTDEQILKQAIVKAQKNHWLPNTKFQIAHYDGSSGTSMRVLGTFDDDGTVETWGRDAETIIFSHDFAKAFWGEEEEQQECDCLPEHVGQFHLKGCASMMCPHCKTDIHYQPPKELNCNHIHYPESCEVCYQKSLNWRDHLRIMVLEENPLQYLAQFL